MVTVGQENTNFEDQMETPQLKNSGTLLLSSPYGTDTDPGIFSLSFRTSCKYSLEAWSHTSERPCSLLVTGPWVGGLRPLHPPLKSAGSLQKVDTAGILLSTHLCSLQGQTIVVPQAEHVPVAI